MGTEVATRKVCHTSFRGEGIKAETSQQHTHKSTRLMVLKHPALKILFSTPRHHRGQHYISPNGHWNTGVKIEGRTQQEFSSAYTCKNSRIKSGKTEGKNTNLW